MVDISKLKSLMADAKSLATELGLVHRDLTDKELYKFGRTFERQFVLPFPERQVVDIHLRHQAEALLGAMVAKEQMEAEIDGELPASGKIGGPLAIRASWLGIGDDWEDIGSIYGTATARGQGYWTPGSPQDWIHSGTLLMGGTDGNAVKIGENALHIVYGIQSLHASPKIESIQFTIDGKDKPILLTFWTQKTPYTLRIKELDNAFVWKEDTTVLAKVFISEAFGDTITQAVDFPALMGVSYIKEPQLRVHDPVTSTDRVLPGTVHDVILTT
jgi:hypothetical protein